MTERAPSSRIPIWDSNSAISILTGLTSALVLHALVWPRYGRVDLGLALVAAIVYVACVVGRSVWLRRFGSALSPATCSAPPSELPPPEACPALVPIKPRPPRRRPGAEKELPQRPGAPVTLPPVMIETAASGEPCAPPNGGPATSTGNPGSAIRPPSSN